MRSLPPQSRLEKAVEDIVSDSFSIVLRRDYLELIELIAAGVEGKVIRCAATLIAYYRHWQEWKQEHQRTDWVYQPLRQIYKDLMGLFSIPVIRAANDLLIDVGLLERRSNPGNGQDKTYQYNVRFDRIRQLLTENRAASPFEKTDVSSEKPEVAASHVNTHHQVKSIPVRSTNPNAIWKDEEENRQGMSLSSHAERPVTNEEPGEVRRLIAESLGKELDSEAISLLNHTAIKTLPLLDNDEVINTEPERKEFERSPRLIRIPGLDELGHQILHKHQAQLLKLNVDLHAEYLQQAITDHTQHLEDAIFAFFEASAKGPLTAKKATGFLSNALRSGWKPRQSPANSSQTLPACYTPHPLMVKPPKPPAFEDLVEQKRWQWKHAPILRQSIEVWAAQTSGIVMGAEGPELMVEEALVSSPTDLLVADPGTEPLTDNAEATRPSAIVTTSASPEAIAPGPGELLAEPPTEPQAAPPAPINSATSAPTPGPERATSLTQAGDQRAAVVDQSASSSPLAAEGASAQSPMPAQTAKPPMPWYAETIKPRQQFASPFSTNQRVKYEGQEYRIAIPGYPRSQLEGMKCSVPNDWLEPLESND